MNLFKTDDIIKVNNINKKIKELTLDDLYNLYEKSLNRTLVKIVNNDVSLLIDEEE